MLILASASPRRRELLERVGFAPVVRPADVDESVHPGEAPVAYAARIAAAKAAAVERAPSEWVLAADTVVEIDGDVLGKATDPDQATAMLGRLAGRTHRVTTAVSLRGPGGAHDLAVTTEVDMVPLDGEAIADYVASGEWQGKAGAYAVQGIAAALVHTVRGSITNVIGLPLAEVVELLATAGAAGAALARGRPA